MPVLTNSIGSATFFDLVGTIYPSQPQYEVIERPGVDGSGARNTGTRGKPFSLESTTYHANFSAYKTYLAGCVSLKTSLQTLTRNDESYGDHLILEVSESKPPRAVFNVAGSPGSQCLGKITWTLLKP